MILPDNFHFNHDLQLFAFLNLKRGFSKRQKFERSRQGGRTWQPFVGDQNGHENFRQVRIFATNASFLRVIENLQI